MIIKGKSRAAAPQLAAYLLAQGKNESVEFIGANNVLSKNLKGALLEMQELAELSDCQKFLYHASINPQQGEHLTAQQWEQSVDLLEKNLGLEGHQRAIVKHVKEGRAHYHIVWDRVDPDTLTAVRMSHNYRAHELTSRELEREFGLERVQGAHVERDGPRPERQPKQWEVDRGRRSGIDPRAVKAEVSELWAWAQNGADFATALEARGYILAQGDRRDFVIIDRNGDPHSVTRRTGAKADEVRAKLADIEREALPTVEQAKEMQDERRDHKATTSLEKSYERSDDMVTQQQAATRHHEQRQKALDHAAAQQKREAEALKRLEAKAQKQRDHEGKQREEQRARDQGGFAGRKDQGQQKREEKAARTEQTEAQKRHHQKEIMREIFEKKFGKGHNERDREGWERERERER